MKKIMIDNRNTKIIAFALVAVLLLIGTVGLASASAAFMNATRGGGLIAYYPFNGDAKDKSGNGNDGTVYGATWVDNGGCGKALSFDGRDDYVEVPDSPSLDITDAITVEAWVKSNNIGAYQHIVDKGGRDPSAYQISFYQSKPYGWIKTAEGVRHNYNGNTILQGNTWYHFVLTYDGYHYRYYINGQLSFETSLSGEIYTNDYELNIGREGGKANSAFFDGTIDEVRIYNYAKTQSQVQEDMNRCTPATPSSTQPTTTAEAVITVKSPEEGARYPAGESVLVDWSAEMPTDIACWTSYVNGERRAAAERAKGPFGKRAFESYGTGYPTHTEGKEGLNVLRIEIELVDGRKYEKEVVFYIETTSTTPSTPADTPSITECDSTARAIIKAVGGCDALDRSRYPAIYEACCSKITKEYLLDLLNAALTDDGKITSDEKKQLLDALNTYLEMRP